MERTEQERQVASLRADNLLLYTMYESTHLRVEVRGPLMLLIALQLLCGGVAFSAWQSCCAPPCDCRLQDLSQQLLTVQRIVESVSQRTPPASAEDAADASTGGCCIRLAMQT